MFVKIVMGLLIFLTFIESVATDNEFWSMTTIILIFLMIIYNGVDKLVETLKDN